MSDPNEPIPTTDQAVPAETLSETPAGDQAGAVPQPETAAPAADAAPGEQAAAPAAPTGPVPPPLAADEAPLVLPSGVVAVMRAGKGRDLLAAQRTAGNDENMVAYGLIASLCLFDGQKKVVEDILEMPLPDVMKLISRITRLIGGDFLPSPSGPSSTSPQ